MNDATEDLGDLFNSETTVGELLAKCAEMNAGQIHMVLRDESGVIVSGVFCAAEPEIAQTIHTVTEGLNAPRRYEVGVMLRKEWVRDTNGAVPYQNWLRNMAAEARRDAMQAAPTPETAGETSCLECQTEDCFARGTNPTACAEYNSRSTEIDTPYDIDPPEMARGSEFENHNGLGEVEQSPVQPTNKQNPSLSGPDCGLVPPDTETAPE